jgi:hypothetical protein
VFVYYYFGGKEKEQKIESVKKVIKNIRHIHKGKDIVIQLEYADEYKEKELMPLLIKNNPLFIVPDGYLAVFIGKLNNISGNIGSYDRMYTLIREKIRLQVFEWGEEKMYLTSNDRL